jgi:hypothetical protein
MQFRFDIILGHFRRILDISTKHQVTPIATGFGALRLRNQSPPRAHTWNLNMMQRFCRQCWYFKGYLHEATDCYVAGDVAQCRFKIRNNPVCKLPVASCHATMSDTKITVRVNRPLCSMLSAIGGGRVSYFGIGLIKGFLLPRCG